MKKKIASIAAFSLIIAMVAYIIHVQCNSGTCNNQKAIHKEKFPVYNDPVSDSGEKSEKADSSRTIEKIPVEHGGKFFITGAEIVYIQNGSIEWQSSEIKKYAKSGGKFYIATGNNLFCTDNHGSIIWKLSIKNSGSCTLEEGELVVFTESGTRKFNPASGETIQ